MRIVCEHGNVMCVPCLNAAAGRKETLQQLVDLAERKRVLGQIPPAEEDFVRDLVKELQS